MGGTGGLEKKFYGESIGVWERRKKKPKGKEIRSQMGKKVEEAEENEEGEKKGERTKRKK